MHPWLPHTLRHTLLLVIATAGLSLPAASAVPVPPAPGSIEPGQSPILVQDDTFLPTNWSVAAEASGGASYTVSQQLTGGHTSPPFRFMSHRIPPVASGLSTIFVTHIYLGFTYDPSTQGAISAISYSEAGIILSFPFPDAFTTTQPVVVQGGRIFRSPRFLRFAGQNSSHTWEIKSLAALTADDFFPPGGAENDNPDFSESGGPIQFGFARNNSRSSTLPPVPADQDLVIDHGLDRWQLIITREPVTPPPNRAPVAVADIFIIDGSSRSLPLLRSFDLIDNDSDPDQDRLEITAVTQPLHGAVGILSSYSVFYQLDEAVVRDSFGYTVSDLGGLSSSAEVQVLIDCACTALCLSNLVQVQPGRAGAADTIDLPLIYRFRDLVLKSTPGGRRYVDMYYTSNPEILVTIMSTEALRSQAVATVELWQDLLRSLVDGDGSATVTQAHVDALDQFLSDLAAASSPALQQLIADELARIGPLDDYAGLTIREARRRAIGDPMLYLPLIGQ